jgi:hypothetical protein
MGHGGKLHSFFTSAIDGENGQFYVPHAFSLYPRVKSTKYPLIRGWMRPRTDLGLMMKRSNPILVIPYNNAS